MTTRRWLLAAGAIPALMAACGRAPSPVPTSTPTPMPTASGFTYAPVKLRISLIEAPATAPVGQPLTVTVTVVLPNGCTEYQAIDTAIAPADDAIVFTARGLEAQHAVCTQILTFHPVTVTLTPTEAGTYTLRGADGEASTRVTIQ